MLLKILCRYTIKRNAQGYWQILFPICTQISYAALLEISRKNPDRQQHTYRDLLIICN